MNTSNLIQTLSELVQINSINPSYADGVPEREIQSYVSQFFREHGLTILQQEVLPQRQNTIAVLKGRQRARRIVFEAHTDTVGVEGMVVPPFTPMIRNGLLYGRGSCDTKAGLAAMMHALADLKNSGITPPCEVWVAATVDEEHQYRGVLKLCEGLSAVGAVVSEPTEMRMGVASKGCVRWRITVQGRAAHSSKPHLGVNAIQHMARVLVELEREARHLGAVCDPLVGAASLNVGLIEGGTQVNVVPESCSITLDRRLVRGEEPTSVLAGYHDFLDRLQASNPELEVRAEPPLVYDLPLDVPLESTVVKCAAAVLGQHGLDARPAGMPFGSDASKFVSAGIPAIILGPGSIDQAHTVDEFISLEEVEQAFSVYRDLMRTME